MSFILLGILNSQAAGAVVPEPDFLTSAPLWLDAADASTITESGGSVSQWDNKGTLENLTQATSADQPTTGVTTLNGLNVLDFSGDFMVGSVLANWKFLHDGTDYFFCAVQKFGNTASPGGTVPIMGTSEDNSSLIGAAFYYDDRSGADLLQISVTSGVGGTAVLSVGDANFIVPNDFQIISGLLDPNASVGNRIEYYNGNTQGTEVISGTGSVTSSNPTNLLEIGGIGGEVQTATGSIAEIVIVNGADATEENRQATVDYLNAKWGVF
jgi:hypothetical protein